MAQARKTGFKGFVDSSLKPINQLGIPGSVGYSGSVGHSGPNGNSTVNKSKRNYEYTVNSGITENIEYKTFKGEKVNFNITPIT